MASSVETSSTLPSSISFTPASISVSHLASTDVVSSLSTAGFNLLLDVIQRLAHGLKLTFLRAFVENRTQAMGRRMGERIVNGFARLPLRPYEAHGAPLKSTFFPSGNSTCSVEYSHAVPEDLLALTVRVPSPLGPVTGAVKSARPEPLL